jgi:hypothetical protein
MLTPPLKPSRWTRLKARWPLLNNAQKFYAISCVLAFLNLFTAFQFSTLLGLLGLTAITALTCDIWHVFEHLWHKLAGKAFLVSIYLVLGNYCYALAQSQVNTLVGIRPDLVPHSVHMNLFLLAPLWCFALACAVLILYTAYHTGKGALMLVLRPFGVRSHHLSDEAHPVMFLVIRVLLLPVTITYLAIAISGYMVAGNVDGTDINLIGDANEKPIHIETKLTKAGVQVDDAATDSQTPTQPAPESLTFMKGSSSNPLQILATPNLPWIDRIVAGFLYNVESMGRSQCQLSGEEHLVPLNDYEVLIITPDAKEPSGFKFHTRPCNSPNLPKVQLVNPA